MVNRLAVIDCSVVATWFVVDEKYPACEQILSDIYDDKMKMVVPR